MTFRLANVAGRTALVDANDNWHDLHRLTAGAVSADPMKVLRDPSALHRAALRLERANPDGPLATAMLGAPVPQPRNCIAIGKNYLDHAVETGSALPPTPLAFTKFPSCIVGPNADVTLRSASADYEVELVVVIGKPGRDIAPANAWAHVLGLTIGQDISDRELQFASTPPHFDLGKSRDTYGPLGPTLVSVDSFSDPDDIALSCSVNGDERQRSSTGHLIFPVAQLIAYLSGIMTLGVGDIIFTGTPAGVGMTTKTFLRPGDVIVSTIDGIGTMTNTCVA